MRKALAMRLRALRKQQGLSQERLGEKARLSGKFIGEVEREEKSISIDSLWRVAGALEVPLTELTDVGRDTRPASVREEMERIRALFAGKPGEQLRQAYRVLEVFFDGLASKPRRRRTRRR
ncbi:MAG: helix-turn-helix transcriptional regulator [bacterium]|nr:helix-turn-helix transcriptional regulator [bacterium]